MSVLKSTLLQDPKSMLAVKFGETWTVQESELVNGAVFFDQDPELFAVALQHLRLKSMNLVKGPKEMPTVHQSKVSRMTNLIKYLALDSLEVQQNPHGQKQQQYYEHRLGRYLSYDPSYGNYYDQETGRYYDINRGTYI